MHKYLLALALSLVAVPSSAEGVDGKLVVQFKDLSHAPYKQAASYSQELEWSQRYLMPGDTLKFEGSEGAKDGIAVMDATESLKFETLEQVEDLLQSDPDIAFVEPLQEYHADFVPNDPDYKKQWNLRQINMEKAWDVAQGDGVVVAVIDTGSTQVPDLKGTKFVEGYNFVGDNGDARDDNGHGTHVAGTIAQTTNNKEGVAGVAFKASIMPLKVLSAMGSGNTADIAEAIRYAADHGAKVINMSLGGGAPSKVMADAVKYAHDKGVFIACAAGNAGRPVVEYPAAYPGSFAVSSVGPTGTLAPYSSYGKEIQIAAPGGDKSQGEAGGILQQTVDPNNDLKPVYAYFQGTSMATPHVAGAAAVLFSAGAKSPAEVEKALIAGAKSRGSQWSEKYGNGLLDVAASLNALKGTVVNTAVPSVEYHASGALGMGRFFLGVLLALFVMSTLRFRQRQPMLPSLLITLFFTTAGLFFLPGPGPEVADASWFRQLLRFIWELLDTPLPDWNNIIKWTIATPIFYSSFIPVIAAIVGYNYKAVRQAAGGLCIGFASFLLFAAITGVPGFNWLPLRLLVLPWYLFHTVVSLFLARALVRKTDTD